MVKFITEVGKIVSLFVLWNWGQDGVFTMSFHFRGILMIINRLKWLSLLLAWEKIVSSFVLWNWGQDGVFAMSFHFRGMLMIFNRLK